ncbi:TetR/AcrR family transcriptional regulator [Prosthecomicrobium pneumaticum]|uniref:AcrR family transcriptional regulator n=1 Tax=Prosthecomicrobium pneumaticum TaxID=81895 RepID=A0A7W9FQF8_9HYPH|nr:TetR/AcrR family transcriptional regulator [Prosthecomicrobium pneumaticum]MBB5754984.1 AcrR family transcriptional regulator [Prosthecomicrobium pneumaticum]
MSTDPLPSTDLDRRGRKRRATRRAISDVATRLFLERGFDAVTIDEIAAAADVGRMTVFNHFPRKEDLLFDRDEEGRALIRDALRGRAPGVAPVEALRRFAHRLVAENHPAVAFSARSAAFIATVAASETLKARARAIRDELAGLVAVELAGAAGHPPAGPDGSSGADEDRMRVEEGSADRADAAGPRPAGAEARLAADLLVAAWSAAFLEAHRRFAQTADRSAAETAFLALIDRGSRAAAAALADPSAP